MANRDANAIENVFECERLEQPALFAFQCKHGEERDREHEQRAEDGRSELACGADHELLAVDGASIAFSLRDLPV
jgi:hypothetical protein